MRKSDIIIGLLLIIITILLATYPNPKVGSVLELDNGRAYFYVGYEEIISKEHHQILIQKYVDRR